MRSYAWPLTASHQAPISTPNTPTPVTVLIINSAVAMHNAFVDPASPLNYAV